MGVLLLPPLFEVIIKPKGELYTVTFYPDAHPELTSVDGRVAFVRTNGATWAQVHDSIGNEVYDDDVNQYCQISGRALGYDGQYNYIRRTILLFDTSSIPASATIISATLTIFGSGKTQSNITGISIAPYTSNPASPIALVAPDYNTLGSVLLAPSILYADYDDNGYNSFTLNSAGLSAIAKAGITKLGLREATYDGPNNEPTWAPSISAQFVHRSADDPDRKPSLTVTYRA